MSNEDTLRPEYSADLIGLGDHDKTSLYIFWLKDKSLAGLEKLPASNVLAEQIIENLEVGLSNFRDVVSTLQS